MPESLPIALALVALAVAGWDCARRYMQLAHGRMLSADRSQTFERAITALDLSNKQLDHGLDQLKHQLDELSGSFADVGRAHDGSLRLIRELQTQMNLAPTMENISVIVERLNADQKWQNTCERSIELLQADIDKRDKAITNVAEEVAGLQRQQALALMGIAKTPKHGYAPGGPK